MWCGEVRPGKPPGESCILLGMREAFCGATLYRKPVKLLYVFKREYFLLIIQ